MIEAQTNARQYIASLTGLRGVAALLVFVYHFGALHPTIRADQLIPVVGKVLQFPLDFGSFGVDIFFVLSGFLLTIPFARSALQSGPHPNLLDYFKRRFLRVLPAYYAQLIIIVLVGSWFLTWKAQTVTSFFAQLAMFFYIGWFPVEPIVGVWWTLPVEMGFYLILPLLAWFMRPGRWILLLLAGLILSMVYRIWAAAHFGAAGGEVAFIVASQLPGSLSEFFLGASAALLTQWVATNNRQRPSARTLDVMFILGIALAVTWLNQVVLANAAQFWLGHWSMVVTPLALGLPLSITVLALYWGSPIGTLLLSNRVVYFLGLISYSLYLWHFVVMQQLPSLMGENYVSLGPLSAFLVDTTAVVLIATISFYAIEMPFYKPGKPGLLIK